MRGGLASSASISTRCASVEPDAALGNGGLGRLAACFMESMATLGDRRLRLRHPLRARPVPPGDQGRLAAGVPGDWLRFGNPWEFERPEVAYPIGFGGTVERGRRRGRRARGMSGTRPRRCRGVAYDTPVSAGAAHARQHAAPVVRPRRRSAAARRLQPRRPCRRAGGPGARRGHLPRALSRRRHAGRPGTAAAAGVSSSPPPRCRTCCAATSSSTATLRTPGRQRRDPAQRHPSGHRHRRADAPAGRCPRLRLGRGLGHHRGTFSYTNHTLLPEALETWPVQLMERLLPRHMQIIYLINARHLDQLRAAGPPATTRCCAAVSLIDERQGRRVRMGHLAFLGSHTVNGVSALHTELMRADRVPRPERARIPAASSTRPTASPSAAGCTRPTPA